ncbi:MAG: aldo/keto reductase [Alicyclobacillaceae bacterium]|nr:aldo/keto reductase [Alicyclobacillaceae bacterium]
MDCHLFSAEAILCIDSLGSLYGPFTNEELVGKAIRGRRDRVILATKFGNERAPDGTFIRINGRPEYVRKACEGSLRRLGVDYIDLYYYHRIDLTVPVEETIGAMADLFREGKVRYIGISEAAPATIRRAHATYPLTALQTEYSLWSRDPEDEIFASPNKGEGLRPTFSEQVLTKVGASETLSTFEQIEE